MRAQIPWIVAAIAITYLVGVILTATPAPAVTVEDVISGRYADDQPAIVIPENSVTTCVGEGVYRQCSNRSLDPEPQTNADCLRGMSMVTIRKYGYVSRICVPE